jgi:sec-independent protein translocase protein TatA
MGLYSVFLGMFGGGEVLLVLLIIIIIFGGRKIPELMKGVGKGIKEFKKENSDDNESESSK